MLSPVLLAITAVVIGIFLYRDYGISWDEPISRENGLINLNYVLDRWSIWVFNNDSELAKFKIDLNEYRDRDYGVAFELPVALLERALGFEDSREIFMFRHLMTYLVFVAGLLATYRLAERRFGDWRIGLLAAAVLLLSPRIFAESFYNSKDIVFMALIAVAMNLSVAFALRPTLATAGLAALATAIAIDVRIMAVILLPATLTLVLLRSTRRDLRYGAVLAAVCVYAVGLVVAVIAFWPWLWEAPFARFAEAFNNMSRFRWEASLLYMGESIKATELPWHYIPVYITITTPILYTVLFVAGVFASVWRIVANRFKINDDESMQDLFFGLVMCPIVAVIALKSVVYDGWRHMYFIYPAFVLVGVGGAVFLWRTLQGAVLRGAFAIAFGLSLVHTAGWIARAHPFQNNYFNALVGSDWKSKFEVDYWGVANRHVLENLVKIDPGRPIRVKAVSLTPLQTSLLILTPAQRALVTLSDSMDADYILTNYRNNRTDYGASGEYVIAYELRIDGEIIVSAYRPAR